MGQCKLCHKERKLLKKSHIIPDFLYKNLYDENHFVHKLNPKELKKGKKATKVPTGEYEGRLLCRKCDNEVIGQYESYSNIALFGGKLPADESPVAKNYKAENGITFTHLKNISYKKYKLFLFSILWRAHISNREFFKEVDLNEKADRLRKMILNDDPGEELEFPIWSLTFLKDKDAPNDIISQPTIIDFNGSEMALFIINGMIYNFYISGNEVPDVFSECTIKKSNEMVILHIPEGKSFDYLLRYHGFK